MHLVFLLACLYAALGMNNISTTIPWPILCHWSCIWLSKGVSWLLQFLFFSLQQVLWSSTNWSQFSVHSANDVQGSTKLVQWRFKSMLESSIASKTVNCKIQFETKAYNIFTFLVFCSSLWCDPLNLITSLILPVLDCKTVTTFRLGDFVVYPEKSSSNYFFICYLFIKIFIPHFLSWLKVTYK